jgi:hypothetical protein
MMKPALLAAAALCLAASALAAAPARAEDPKTTTDIRCVVVAISLSGSDDPDVQKVGTTSLLYFWGRLEGRGATEGIAQRILDEAAHMAPDDIKTQSQTCGAMVTAAGQSLQDAGNAIQQKLGPPGK